VEDLVRYLASTEFASPGWLWIAGPLALLLIFLPIRRKAAGLGADLVYWRPRLALKSPRLGVQSALVILATLLLAVALADPQVTVKPSVSIYGKPVMTVIDVSGSMESKVRRRASDTGPVDLRTSFEKARDIFHDLIARKPDVNFGLLLYSTESYVARLFSYKNELLRDTVENKEEVEYISTGTRTAAALGKARSFFAKTITGKEKAIVLITDLDADFEAMVEMAEEMERDLWAGIRIYVIIITGDKKPSDYGIVQSQVEGITMVEMNDKLGIDEICAKLSEMPRSPIRQEEVLLRTSLIPFLAVPALVLIGLSLLLGETRWLKIP
jgi:hypothetical protein